MLLLLDNLSPNQLYTHQPRLPPLRLEFNPGLEKGLEVVCGLSFRVFLRVLWFSSLIKIDSRLIRSGRLPSYRDPRIGITYGGRSFTMAASSVWNTLPLELRSCCSLSSFKSKLKTLLFKASYDVVYSL